MSNSIDGKIYALNSEVQVSDKFRKREVVVQTDEQYPQVVILQFTQDKCSLLDGYKVGDKVKVSFNLRGREWKSPSGEVKYFNTLEGWRIELTEQRASAAPPSRSAPPILDGLPF